MALRQVKYLKLFRGPQLLSVCSGPSGHVVSDGREIVALNDAYEERWRVGAIGIEEPTFVTADVVVMTSLGVGLRGRWPTGESSGREERASTGAIS